MKPASAAQPPAREVVDHPNSTSNPGDATTVGPGTPYSPSSQTATQALSLRADYLRTDVDMLSGEVHELHGATRADELRERAVQKTTTSVAGLLEELTVERGMGWSQISDVIGVSISAIRKWRRGGQARGDSRMKLAQLAAMLDLLDNKCLVQQPAAWLDMDLPVGAGYYIRPMDLYLDGHIAELFDIAEHRQTAASVLDAVRPGWREERSDYDVFTDSDGERSIRLRGGQ